MRQVLHNNDTNGEASVESSFGGSMESSEGAILFKQEICRFSTDCGTYLKSFPFLSIVFALSR